MIYTSDAEAIDPQHIFGILTREDYFVLTVNVNDGERIFRNPDFPDS